MHILFTETAIQRLHEQAPGAPIQLLYDAEGCGCAVSGVAGLRVLQGESAALNERELARADSNAPVPVYFDIRHEVFFEPKLKLDYRPERKTFTLSSDNQIYSNSISLS